MLYFLVARLIWNFKPLVQLMCMDLCSVHPPHVFEIHGVSVQIRKRMRPRLNWDAFVNPRKVAVYKSHSGFMMNGEMETTWCWQSNMPLVALTRISSSHKKKCFLLAKCPHVDVASNFGSLSSPLSRLPNLSWQEQFIKHRTLTHKKEKKEVNDKSVGWYTKEDMQKVLKWNAKLPRI